MFLHKKISVQMAISPLDTDRAITHQWSSPRAGEQKNPWVWGGHLHVSFFPLWLNTHSGDAIGRVEEGREVRGWGWQWMCWHACLSSVDHSLCSYILLSAQNSPTGFLVSIYSSSSTECILFPSHKSNSLHILVYANPKFMCFPSVLH